MARKAWTEIAYSLGLYSVSSAIPGTITDYDVDWGALQRKVKRRPFTHGALRPDATAVAMDDPLDGCQPHARSGEFAIGMQPLEGAEQFRCVGHVKAGARCRGEKDRPLVLGGAKLDDPFGAFGSELARISQEIFQGRCAEAGGLR